MIRTFASNLKHARSQWSSLERAVGIRNLTSLAGKSSDHKDRLEGVISVLNRCSSPLDACIGRSVSRLFSALGSHQNLEDSSPKAFLLARGNPSFQAQQSMHSSSQPDPEWHDSPTGSASALGNLMVQSEEDDRHLDRSEEDSDDYDQLRRVELPLLHPKGHITMGHHPCGADLLEFPFSAKAFYIGKGYKEQVKKLKQAAETHGWQRELGPGSQVICLRKEWKPFDDEEDLMGLPCETYILALDKLDAVVFFNGMGDERETWELHTGGLLSQRFTEETRVSVIPDLGKHSKLFSDRVVLQQAELNYLKTIAFCLGQSVSLHYYEMQVDHVLETFKAMNEVMCKAKSFKNVAKKEELLQMVATNNLLFLDIISKLGIMERFDIAWKDNNCNDIYEHLRTDMEIENRNSNLQVKLQLVSENVKYLLELMQNEKSDFLEWIIILLISAEICVSLFDMFHKVA